LLNREKIDQPNPAIEWSLKMNRISIQSFAVVIAIGMVVVLPPAAGAQNPSETLYKTKCAACHGPDGSGSAVGKKLGAHDFHSAEVQAESDAALTAIIAQGKNKMPAYAKTLKADEITALVAYIRSFAPGK
jgi:mono/diheme cytochrome c family protein